MFLLTVGARHPRRGAGRRAAAWWGAVLGLGVLAWACASEAAAAGRRSKVDPACLLETRFKLVLNLSASKRLRARDVAYSMLPAGRRCAFMYTGPRKAESIAHLSKLGLRTTMYVPPTTSAARIRALEQAGAEVGVTGYWGAIGGYASIIAGNSVQEAFDAVATSRLVVRETLGRGPLPAGTCGGHTSTFAFPTNRNSDDPGGCGAVFQDSNFLSLSFSSQECLSVLLGLAGGEQVALRPLNRNVMRAAQVPNELIYYQLLAGQFEGAVRKAREGQIVQFSLRDFGADDMKLLTENIGEYGRHPAIWHATEGMLASLAYIKRNLHVLDVRRADPKRYEITLGLENDVFAPYVTVAPSLVLPRGFPVESATFEGLPCAVNVVKKTRTPHVTVPIDAYLSGGCAMALEQSAPDMTVPDRMAVKLTLRNTLKAPITDAALTWVPAAKFSGLTPSKRGRGAQTGIVGGAGLTVTGGGDGAFTLAPGESRRIDAEARTVRGARFGIMPVSALLRGTVNGRERTFLGGFEITVAPVMRVEMAPNLRMPLPKGQHQYFEVTLANGKGRDKFLSHKAGACRGKLAFVPHDGLTVEPPEHAFDFGPADEKTFLFKVTNGKWDAGEIKLAPVVRLAGVAEPLSLLEPGTTIVRDREHVDHPPLDDTGLLVYCGWNDRTRGGRFTRSVGRGAPHHFPGTTAAYREGGVKGLCIESQPNCSIHATYKNVDYRRGTILFWFKRDPRVKNENRHVADPATSWRNGGRSNYGEGMVFVRGVQRGGAASGGLDIRRYGTWGKREGYVEAVYRCLGRRAYAVRAPYPRATENQWCHLAVTWSVKDRRLELFLNGKSMGKAPPGETPWYAVPWDNAADWGHPLVVSTMDHGHWSGTLRDEFYVYNRPLSAAEIAANMRSAGASP